MITEQMCVDIVRVIAPQVLTTESGGTTSRQEHALVTSAVYRALLPAYSLSAIETTVRWLELGGYLGYSGFAFAPKMAIILTEKGITLAERGSLNANERRLVYQD